MKRTRKLICLTLAMLMVLSVCGALTVSAAESYRVDSGDGSGVMYTGDTYNSINVHTLSFDTDDYVVIPFSAYAGGTYVLDGQYSQAVRWGYDVVGIINGSFFNMSNGYLNDYLVTNGEVVIGDTNLHSSFGGMTCIMPDGSIQTVAASQLKFATYFNGMEVPGGISYINRRPNRTAADGWTDSLYYYDFTAAGDKCPLAGVAVICKKLNGTVLAIGGTMDAQVVSVEEKSNANGITLAKDEFLLYVRSSSPLAATLKALAPGDSVTVNASETIADAAAITSNATSILANHGYLVKDGENFAATNEFNNIDAHGNKYKAQWTAFGTKADGSWMFFTSEGTSGSRGLTQAQVAEYMISQGCTTVIRLDGGGSVAMYLSDAGNGSAGYKENHGRHVPDCLMVVKRSSAALQPSEETLETLQDLIAQAEDSTSDEAKEALKYAQSVLDNEKSVSGDYTKAVMRLLEALNNKGTLGNILAVASGANFSDYSEYALTRLREAYTAASEVFGNPDATADEVTIATAQLVKWVNAKGEYSTSEVTYPKMSTDGNFKLLKFNTKIAEGDITLFTPGMSVVQDSANLKWAGAILLRKNAHGSYVVEKVINGAAVGSDTYVPNELGFTVVPDDCLVLGAHGEVNNTAVRTAAVVGSIFTPHGIDIEKQTIGVGAYFSFETATGEGHTFDWKVTKAPTCHEKGSEILTCVHCGATSGSARTIDELDHVYKDGKCLLCGDFQPTNVALGKKYTIGYGTNNATYNASLTDGLASTGLSYQPNEWFGFVASNTQNNVGTATIDLGDDYVINYASVHTYFGKTGDGVVTPASMKVEVSSDGINYTALGAEVTYANPEQGPGFTTEWVNFVGEESITGRYVKLTVVIQGAFAFLNEIEVYGVPVKGEDPETPVTSTNVALNKEVTAKKAAAIPQYSNAKLTDGVIATTMGYGNPADEWFSFYYNENYADQVNIDRVDFDGTVMNVGNLVIDLAGLYDIDSVRIHYNKDFVPETTNIYVSEDGVNYTKIVGKATAASDGEVIGYGCWIEFPLDDVATAKYVKVEFVFSGMFAMLDEVEVYGVEATEEDPGEDVPTITVPVEEEIEVDGVLDDTGYDVADWVDNGYWQGAEIPEEDISGKYTVRTDDENIYIALEIDGTIAPHTLDTYNPDKFDQASATNLRIWLKKDVETRTFFDIQYNGTEFTLANWNTTHDAVKNNVTFVVNYEDGKLVAEICVPMADLGIEDSFYLLVSYCENFATGYNAIHFTTAKELSSDYWQPTNTSSYTYYTVEDIELGIYEKEIPCEHETTTETIVDPTCTEDGYASIVCDDCGTEIFYVVLPALGHDYKDGVCTRCDHECEHEHTTESRVNPTCTEDGYEKIFCEDCGMKISDVVLPASGHDYVDGVCTRCEEKDPNYKEDDPKDPAGMLGDLNGDGKINATDYMLVKRYVLGTKELTEEQLKLADVNHDGKVNASDYMLVKRVVLGTYEFKEANA